MKDRPPLHFVIQEHLAYQDNFSVNNAMQVIFVFRGATFKVSVKLELIVIQDLLNVQYVQRDIIVLQDHHPQLFVLMVNLVIRIQVDVQIVLQAIIAPKDHQIQMGALMVLTVQIDKVCVQFVQLVHIVLKYSLHLLYAPEELLVGIVLAVVNHVLLVIFV